VGDDCAGWRGSVMTGWGRIGEEAILGERVDEKRKEE
jgi:hypothetical protein